MALPQWKAITGSVIGTANGRLNERTEIKTNSLCGTFVGLHQIFPTHCTPQQVQGVSVQLCRKQAEDNTIQVACVFVEGMHRSLKSPLALFANRADSSSAPCLNHGFNFSKTAAEALSVTSTYKGHHTKQGSALHLLSPSPLVRSPKRLEVFQDKTINKYCLFSSE